MWLPTERVPVAPLVALPLETVTGNPKLLPSILNWTLPAALLGETAAVNVTD